MYEFVCTKEQLKKMRHVRFKFLAVFFREGRTSWLMGATRFGKVAYFLFYTMCCKCMMMKNLVKRNGSLIRVSHCDLFK